jgi:RNA polymerase sigma-32 factor
MAQLNDETRFRVYVDSIQRFQPLDLATEQALARRWQKRGDASAAHALVESHLRFVVKIARGYRGYGLRVEDLVEEGNIGLMEAVRRYDPDRGLRFMTYAAYWIRAYILAHVLKQWSIVGVGTGPMQSRLFFRMARERAKITAALGAGAEESRIVDMLAKKFNTSPERIRDMTSRLEGKDHSLDAAAYKDGGVTAIELLSDRNSEPAEDRSARIERDDQVKLRLSSLTRGLTRRERYILDHRLYTDEPDTLAEIGKRLSLSRERVRQLEERLKGKLRRVLADFSAAA